MLKTKFKQAGLMLSVFTVMFLINTAATAQTSTKHRLVVTREALLN
jgi:hypothetical protein